jgi:hyperosmotically inducible protein
MKNRKFIVSVVLASIFLAPVLAVAENKDSEFRVGEFVKDSAITAEIKSKLLIEKDIDSLHIKVDTDSDGIVVLTGTVKTEEEKERVRNIAQSADGVKHIINNLEINPNQ